MADSSKESAPSTTTVVVLIVLLIVLLALLFFLYIKLNREANGEYTIQNIIYKDGGVRDQVRGAVRALETRLGVQIWPRSDSGEDGEEMQEVYVEERQVEDGSSQGSDDERDEDEESEEEERSRDKSDTSGDNSSLEGSEAGDNVKLLDKGDEKEKLADQDFLGEASGGPGLLIDIKQLSGSVTWSEDGVCKDGDVTAL